MVAGVLGAFIQKPKVQQLLGQTLGDSAAPGAPGAPTALRIMLLEVIASSGLKAAPESWTKALLGSLQAKDADTLISASRAIGSLEFSAENHARFNARLSVIAGELNFVPAHVRNFHRSAQFIGHTRWDELNIAID